MALGKGVLDVTRAGEQQGERRKGARLELMNQSSHKQWTQFKFACGCCSPCCCCSRCCSCCCCSCGYCYCCYSHVVVVAPAVSLLDSFQCSPCHYLYLHLCSTLWFIFRKIVWSQKCVIVPSPPPLSFPLCCPTACSAVFTYFWVTQLSTACLRYVAPLCL